MEAILKQHCNRRMTIYPFDKIIDGDASYKDPIEILVYYEPEIQMVRDMNGREVVSQGIIFVKDEDVGKISIKDMISVEYLPDVQILNLQAFQELFGPGWDHLEVYV